MHHNKEQLPFTATREKPVQQRRPSSAIKEQIKITLKKRLTEMLYTLTEVMFKWLYMFAKTYWKENL